MLLLLLNSICARSSRFQNFLLMMERWASASSLALAHCAIWRAASDVSGVTSNPLGAEEGSWVWGSMPIESRRFFRWVFHKFLISLSVLPGSCDAIAAHLDWRSSWLLWIGIEITIMLQILLHYTILGSLTLDKSSIRVLDRHGSNGWLANSHIIMFFQTDYSSSSLFL